MNTVGKTLVILNFIFAVIVGGLLVFDVALRNNWKERYELLVKESTVLKSAREQDQVIKEKLTADWRSARIANEEIQQKMTDNKVAFDIAVRDLTDQKGELENKLLNANATLAQSQKTQARLTQEIALLNTTIKDREELIVKLELDVKGIRIQAQNLESQNRARQSQNENLLQQIRDLTGKIARMESGVNPDTMVLLDPSRPNPPPVVINGQVEFVNGDLIQVSLGTDHGLDKNNTLDVYRLKPEPKYLGMVRITDAKHKSSVGRLIQTGNQTFRPVLQQGDLVTSKLTR